MKNKYFRAEVNTYNIKNVVGRNKAKGLTIIAVLALLINGVSGIGNLATKDYVGVAIDSALQPYVGGVESIGDVGIQLIFGENVDMKDIWNITNIPFLEGTTANFTAFNQAGNAVLDTSDTANLNVNKSDYWDDYDTPYTISTNGSLIAVGTVNESRLPTTLYTIGLNGSKIAVGIVGESYLPSSIYTISLNGSKVDSGFVLDTYVSDNLTISSGGIVDKGALNNSGTLGFDWNDTEISDNITIGSSGSVHDSALSAAVAHLNETETISANWVNTANPWADGEVSDTITASNYVRKSTWTDHDNYPSACSAGDYVSAIGDTLTCSTPAGGGGGQWDITGSTWLYNNSGILDWNGTKGNATYVQRDLWTSIDNYPSACSAGQTVSEIGDTLTCINPVAASGDSATSFFSSGSISTTYTDAKCTSATCADAVDECSDCAGTFVDEGQADSISSGMVAFNYAASASEGGSATTGDSATSFFSSGTLEDERLSFTLQDAVDDGGCTDCITDTMVSNTLTASEITCSGCVAETEIAQNTLDDSEIEDNSLTADSLAPNSCDDSELVNNPSFPSYVTTPKIITTAPKNLTLDPTGNHVLPGSDSTDYLGGDGNDWKGAYIDNITITYNSTVHGNIWHNGTHLILEG